MVFEYVLRAWETYKKNIMSFITAELISFIIVGIIVLIGVGIIISFVGISTLLELSESELPITRITSFFPVLTGLSIASLFFMIAGLVWVYLEVGIFGMATEALRGKTRVETMFKFVRKRGIIGVLSSILVGIMTFLFMIIVVVGLDFVLPTLGSIIGIILLFFFMLFFSLFLPAIVVDNLGSIEAIGRSFKVVKENYFDIFGLMIFYSALYLALIIFVPVIGHLICYFVLGPTICMSLVFFYKRNK